MKAIKLYLLFFLGILLSISQLEAQVVTEYSQNEVYNYLNRMDQKGLVTFHDLIRPISRIYIKSCLDSLQAKANLLTTTEKKELDFYLRDFTDGLELPTGSEETRNTYFTKDPFGRFRSIAIHSKEFRMRVDPILQYGTYQGKDQSVTQYGSGFNLYGYAGKHWGFYLSFNDVNEKGKGIDTTRSFTPETGFSTRIAPNQKSHNYSQIRAGIYYQFKNGSIGFGQDQLSYGYGENGRIVLSNKAPTYPLIRFDFAPLPWLRFNFTHAWLNSDIIDSSRTYNTGTTTYGGRREQFINKYMAQHSIQFRIKRGLHISLGESIVYSDQLNVGYLIPISFFKVFEIQQANNNINAGANSQLFLSVSSRNNIKNTHLYGTIFIDEVRLSAIANSEKSRNQLGFTLGASVTDLGLPYLTATVEYTRINPFVYRNLLPAQNYTHYGYSLGDWMGSNADRFLFNVKYTPIPRLKLLLQYQYIRKGGEGTLDQQYFQQPQPPFLFNYMFNQNEWFLQSQYELYNNLYLTGSYRTQNNGWNQGFLGFRYGF